MLLRVSQSKRYDIGRRYQTDYEGLEDVVKEWLAHHPAPSWKGLARTLHRSSQLRSLQRLYGKYLAGMWTCMLFLSEMTCVSSTVCTL